MLTWLKNKISEKIARTYQELHTQKLQNMSKNLPKELVRVNEVLATLNNNSWAVHHLFKKARHKKQYANAFLYFFYSFELTSKHLIISEMNLRNMEVALLNLKNGMDFFLIYKENQILELLEDRNTAGSLITKFINIFPNYKYPADLCIINTERNNIIHNMLKKEMSEVSIERSFEEFFSKCDLAIRNMLVEFDSIFAKRPKNFLEKLAHIKL